MSMSNYLENATLDHIFGKATLTSPTLYVGLSTTAPAEDGTNVTEPSAGAYARITTAAADWSVASTVSDKGELNNVNTLSFAEATADWVGGTDLAYTVVYDAPTGGNLLFSGAVQTPRAVLTGDTAKFLAGQIIVRLD